MLLTKTNDITSQQSRLWPRFSPVPNQTILHLRKINKHLHVQCSRFKFSSASVQSAKAVKLYKTLDRWHIVVIVYSNAMKTTFDFNFHLLPSFQTVLDIFPKAFSQGCHPKWQFPKLQLPKCIISEVATKDRLGPLRRRRLQWGPGAAAKIG